MTTPVQSKQAPTAGGGAPPERVESGPVGSASLYPVLLSSVIINTNVELDNIQGKQVFDFSGNPIGVIEGLWFDKKGTVSTVELRLSSGVLVVRKAEDFALLGDGRVVLTGSSTESILERAKALLAESGTSLNVRARDVALAEEKEGYILLVLKTGLYIEIPKAHPEDWRAYLHHNGETTVWRGSER